MRICCKIGKLTDDARCSFTECRAFFCLEKGRKRTEGRASGHAAGMGGGAAPGIGAEKVARRRLFPAAGAGKDRDVSFRLPKVPCRGRSGVSPERPRKSRRRDAEPFPAAPVPAAPRLRALRQKRCRCGDLRGITSDQRGFVATAGEARRSSSDGRGASGENREEQGPCRPEPEDFRNNTGIPAGRDFRRDNTGKRRESGRDLAGTTPGQVRRRPGAASGAGLASAGASRVKAQKKTGGLYGRRFFFYRHAAEAACGRDQFSPKKVSAFLCMMFSTTSGRSFLRYMATELSTSTQG